MVLLNQVIGVIFSLVMLYLTFLFYKKNTYAKVGFILWTVAWIIAGLLIAFAESFQGITKLLSFGRVTDLYTALALGFFAIIIFFNYAAVKRSEKKVEDLVRALAIKEAKKKR